MLRGLLAGAALTLLAATPAPAAEYAVGDLEAGPVFAGGHLTWAERDRPEMGRQRPVIRTLRGRRETQRPPAAAAPLTVDASGERLAGSPRGVALLRQVATCGLGAGGECFYGQDLVAGGGRAYGALRRLGTRLCEGHSDPAAADVTGRRIVFVASPLDCDSGEGAQALVVRDLGTGRSQVIARSLVGFRGVRAAGPYVTWMRQPDAPAGVVALYDLRLGRVVRRVRADALGGEAVAAWDVRADGAVAMMAAATHGRRGGRLGWFPPGRAARRLAVERVLPPDMEFEFAGHGIAYTAGEYSRDRLYVARLGGAVRQVAAFGPGRARIGQVAFDGRRLAWAEVRTPPRCPPTVAGPQCPAAFVGARFLVVRRAG